MKLKTKELKRALEMKLYIWQWTNGHSWEKAIAFAPDLSTAIELAKKSGLCYPEMLKQKPEIHDKPVCLVDIY